MENGQKKFYKSTTIQGGVIAMLMFLVQIFDIDLDQGLLTEFITGLFGLIAIGVTIYGRIAAKYKIK